MAEIVIYPGNFTILLGVFYRPPASNPDLFMTKLIEMLTVLRLAKYHKIILCGDFNIYMLNLQDGVSRDFTNIMNWYSLLPLISKATRITADTATLIDNIFSSFSINCTAGAILSDICDHLPLFLVDHTWVSQKNGNSDTRNFTYRLINDSTMEDLRNKLSEVNFDRIFEHYEVPSKPYTVGQIAADDGYIAASVGNPASYRFVIYEGKTNAGRPL